MIEVVLLQSEQVLDHLGGSLLLVLLDGLIVCLLLKSLARVDLCDLHHTRGAIYKVVESIFFCLTKVLHLVGEQSAFGSLGSEFEQIVKGCLGKLAKILQFDVENFFVALLLE